MARRNPQPTFRDHETALKAACAEMPAVVVVYGAEAHLRRQALTALQQALQAAHPQIEAVTFHGPASANESGTRLDQVLKELQSDSLFAAEKMVFLRQADRLLFPTKLSADQDGASASKGKPAEELFLQCIETPGTATWLLIECEKVNRQRRLGKALAKHAHLIPCPALNKNADVAQWLRRSAEAMGKSIQRDAVDLLLAAHGSQLGALHAELEKLAIYSGDAPGIRRADVEAFLSGSLEFEIFGLTNAVEARNPAEALLYARRVLVQGTRDTGGRKTDGTASAHRALSMLARTLENILVARILRSQTPTPDALASALGISPWRAEHLARAAQRYPLAHLRQALRSVAQEIHHTHDTGGDVGLSLERSVLACCQANR